MQEAVQARTPAHVWIVGILATLWNAFGAYDYIINGNMIAGFGLIATPARYGETGIMTFMISNNGGIYEKDLGEDSEALAAKIDSFNPDKDWDLVEF